MNKKTLFNTLLVLVTILVAVPTSLVVAANPPEPTYVDEGANPPIYAPTVDGSIDEWDLTNDFFANMYRAFKPDMPVETTLYLRYDCYAGVMYALVYTAGDWPVLVDGDEWFAVGGINNKVSFIDFAWVDQGYDGNSNHAKGWEASFSISPGSYAIWAHTNIDDGGLQTSGTEKAGISLVLDCTVPSAVTLSSFVARARLNRVVVRWQTASEIDNIGFYLYRTDSIDGPRVELSRGLIPSQSPGSAVGADYKFVDRNVELGRTYFYWLADVDTHGVTTLHGPVKVIYGLTQTVQR